MKTFAALAIALAWAGSARTDPPSYEVIGIISLPTALNSDDPAKWTPASFAVRDAPDPAAPTHEVAASALAGQHNDFEQSVLVYETKNGFFRVRLADGDRPAWIPGPKDESYLPLEKFRGEARLASEWDGKLYAAPGGAPVALPFPAKDGYGIDVEVQDARWVDGRLWQQVRLYRGSVCATKKPTASRAVFWVRATGKEGWPAAVRASCEE
jgi:hypothetical protein